MKKIIKEFKEFISKGNVLDLAVGVIIGNAFSKIVTSLVNDVLMPLLGVITGGVDFSSLSIKFKDATILYGSFIQNIIDFLLMAICVFAIVKIINGVKSNLEKLDKNKKENKEGTKEENKDKEEVKKSNEEVLLEEIRDLLKEKRKNEVSKVSKKK